MKLTYHNRLSVNTEQKKSPDFGLLFYLQWLLVGMGGEGRMVRVE